MSWRDKTPSRHELAHERASRGEGEWYRWVNRGGEPVVEGQIGLSRRSVTKSAVILMAGALAGGGDAAGDRKAAEELAAEAGTPIAEVTRRARRYAR